jgi:DNA-binding response OmpR family regulator
MPEPMTMCRKPFAITELMARVRSLLRRSRAPEVQAEAA